MNLQPQPYDAKYLAAVEATGQATNEAAAYDVRIIEANVADGPVWRVIGIHHLTPDENQGAHNVYLQALDENGNRLPKEPKPVWANWTWEGRRPDETAKPVALDKGANEAGGNISVESQGQVVTVWLSGFSAADNQPSDRVENLNTHHPDEAGVHGDLGNTWGHHSYYIVFQRRQSAGRAVINGTIANGSDYRVRLLRGGVQVAEQVADANGAFSFERLARGAYQLEATAPSITSNSIQIDAVDQQVTVQLGAGQ